MNFNVYIDKQATARLERLAKARRVSRNALIREALARLLDQDIRGDWPNVVLDFNGISDMPPFEDTRRGLKAPHVDPFA
ncbi:MAG: ribbon-helix-helix domain-containing protein [Gammaproteobacteria bacterium]